MIKDNHHKAHVERRLEFRLGMTSFTCLGVFIFHGKSKRIHFKASVDQTKACLLVWKGDLSSMTNY